MRLCAAGPALANAGQNVSSCGDVELAVYKEESIMKYECIGRYALARLHGRR